MFGKFAKIGRATVASLIWKKIFKNRERSAIDWSHIHIYIRVHTPYKQKKSKELNEAESEYMNISPLNCSLRADPFSQIKGRRVIQFFILSLGEWVCTQATSITNFSSVSGTTAGHFVDAVQTIAGSYNRERKWRDFLLRSEILQQNLSSILQSSILDFYHGKDVLL